MITYLTTLMLRGEFRECGASLEASATDSVGKHPSRPGYAGHLRARSKCA
jgi:hypothetical protein